MQFNKVRLRVCVHFVCGVFIFVALTISGGLSASFAQETEDTNKSEPVSTTAVNDTSGADFNAEQIIENNKAALVSIWYHTDNYYSYYSYSMKDTTLLNGSGFIFDEHGLVGTNFHVIDGLDSILVKTSDGTFYDAQLLVLDEKNDMAILKLKNPDNVKFQTVKFGNSDLPKVWAGCVRYRKPAGL